MCICIVYEQITVGYMYIGLDMEYYNTVGRIAGAYIQNVSVAKWLIECGHPGWLKLTTEMNVSNQKKEKWNMIHYIFILWINKILC